MLRSLFDPEWHVILPERVSKSKDERDLLLVLNENLSLVILVRFFEFFIFSSFVFHHVRVTFHPFLVKRFVTVECLHRPYTYLPLIESVLLFFSLSKTLK